MPKALFFNVPGHGHVNPSLPLVAELARRGHQITYFVTEEYRARIEAAGAVFQPYAAVHDDYVDARGLSGRVPGKTACELMMTAEEILPELLEVAHTTQPDYILFDGMCPWGYLVARVLGVPAIASLSLMSIPPVTILNWRMLRAFMPVMFRDFNKWMDATKRSRALGKKYGVTPLGQASLLSALGDISISFTSSYFQPAASSVDKTIQFVGWTPVDSLTSNSFSLEHLQNRRLIYVSLGTVNNNDSTFFRMCIEAFADRDEYLIITTGNRFSPDSFGALPKNASVHSWVPQNEVLKKAALFINHAGMNSVHDGLYYGVPLLLVPQQPEQTYTALRVVELGAGLLLEKAQVNSETIQSNAERLLSDIRFKSEANRIGDTFRASGGMRLAGDEIETLLRERAANTKATLLSPQ